MRSFASRLRAFTGAAAALTLCMQLTPAHAQSLEQTAEPNALMPPTQDIENQLSLNRETLGKAMQALLNATIARDLEGTLAYVAPRKIQKIAQSMGKSREEAITELIRIGQEADQHHGVKVLSGHYDLDAAQYGTTSAGRSYALLPYSRTFEKDSSTFERTYLALASLDEAQIFITPLSDDTLLPELIALYPDLAEIRFPVESTRQQP